MLNQFSAAVTAVARKLHFSQHLFQRGPGS